MERKVLIMGADQTILQSMLEKLETFLKTETVVGDPVQVGDTTLVPIISVAFGFGGGGGSAGDNKGGDGSGTGGGVGCKITPNAVLVIADDEVDVIPLSGKGNLDRIIEVIPDVIEKLGIGREDDPEQACEDQ